MEFITAQICVYVLFMKTDAMFKKAFFVGESN